MRSTAAPAEAGHGMGAGAAYTVKTYTEGVACGTWAFDNRPQDGNRIILKP